MFIPVFKHKDGRCAFFLLKRLKKKKNSLRESDPLFISPGARPPGTSVVLLECASNSSPVMGQPGGSEGRPRLCWPRASGSPWKTAFWLRLHHTLPPMEKTEHGEGV